MREKKKRRRGLRVEKRIREDREKKRYKTARE